MVSTILSAYDESFVRTSKGYLDDDLRPKECVRGEFNLFTHAAQKYGDPVLELASGAGRILMVLAGNGFEVFGIEASEHMLNLAKKAISALPEATQKRIHLIQGDMRKFSFKKKFPLIIIPFHSFWYNFKRGCPHGRLFKYDIIDVYEQAENCIYSITNTLKADGLFVIDSPAYCGETKEIQWWLKMSKKYGFSYRISNPYTYQWRMRKLGIRVYPKYSNLLLIGKKL